MNCYFAHDSLGFPVLLPFFEGQSVVLFIHLIATMARLLGPGGVRFIVAESLILKHELLIVARSRATIEFMHVGPHPRRLNGTLGTSNSSAPFRNRSEAFDTAPP